MDVSGVSNLSSFIPQEAAGTKAAKVQQQIQTSVLKSIMDQQKTAGQSIVQMIQNTTPGHIDIRV